VGAEAEVVAIRQASRQSQVEVALRRDLPVGVRNVGYASATKSHVRLVDVAILFEAVVLDRREVAPLAGDSEAVRHREPEPQLVAIFRVRSAGQEAAAGV